MIHQWTNNCGNILHRFDHVIRIQYFNIYVSECADENEFFFLISMHCRFQNFKTNLLRLRRSLCETIGILGTELFIISKWTWLKQISLLFDSHLFMRCVVIILWVCDFGIMRWLECLNIINWFDILVWIFDTVAMTRIFLFFIFIRITHIYLSFILYLVAQ